jgi:hypothetical protein
MVIGHVHLSGMLPTRLVGLSFPATHATSKGKKEKKKKEAVLK